jgi:hypothetical protein
MLTKALVRPEAQIKAPTTQPKPHATQLKNQIQNRAMLVSLTIYSWTARMSDKAVTNTIHASNDADQNAGNYSKKLLPKEALANLNALAIRARTEHYKRTLPWCDDGARILSAKGFLEYTDTIRQIRVEFEKASDEFVQEYLEHKERAKRTLGKLYDPSNYPDLKDIRSKFKMRTRILPFPTENDLRLDIDDETADTMRDQIRKDINESLQAANSDIFLRAQTVLDALVDRMDKFKPATLEDRAQNVFRDSIILNIGELADQIPNLNVTDDPNITMLAQHLKEIAEIDPGDLRRSRADRQETKRKAEGILANLKEMIA